DCRSYNNVLIKRKLVSGRQRQAQVWRARKRKCAIGPKLGDTVLLLEQKIEICGEGLGCELLEGALPRRLVGAEADGLGAVAKAIAGRMIVAHFDDDLWFDRFPLAAALGAPAARAPRRLAGETRRFHERLEFLGQRRALCVRNGRGEADMVELALVVVETEQEGADLVAARGVAEAADHAIGGA